MSWKQKRLSPDCVSEEDREIFIKENAVAVVLEQEEKIARQRKELTHLNKAVASLRRELKKLREIVQSLADRVAAQSEILSRRAEKSKEGEK